MIIVIAESKTMKRDVREVSPVQFSASTPCGEWMADEIMLRLSDYDDSQIGELLGCSPSLARSCRKMIYDFKDKSHGLRALNAFTGVVFRQLKEDEWSEKSREFAGHKLLIISSLYGMLRPLDTVRPYRLDYTSKASPDGEAMYKYLREECTSQLLSILREEGDSEVLMLLPGDAAKCLDIKRLSEEASMASVEFKEFAEGDKKRTPNAGRLKELRGKLLNEIIRNRIASIEGLKDIEADDFLYSGEEIEEKGKTRRRRLEFFC